ncbi:MULTISPECIES: PAS domain S-box protein [unclassified Bradyrhizobium]|uniref:PAS domain S-box protein n=1 Tax=unclassified Bradyrhizobium TaxID=2631580 RepID=UPI0028E46562|nr:MULTISPECIES: PAS domain S-box protein [unclassified Bradyrhizobium]
MEVQKFQSQLLIGLNREQLEGLPWGVVKVNSDGVFTYGNRAMCEIVGAVTIEGKRLADFFYDDDLAVVREHLESRFSRRISEEYEVRATRLTDGFRVPIRCSAMPDINDNGEVVGAIAIVRDLLTEDVSGEIYKAMEDLDDSHAILRAVAKQCERIVSFDFFSVSLYSDDGEHSWTFYLYPEDLRLEVRWRAISAYGKTLAEAKNVVSVADFKEWLARPEAQPYWDDPDSQRFLRMGLNSILSLPVISGNRVVARVGFGRKQEKGSFNKSDEERVARLPLAGAVRMALHYHERDELRFRLKLITRIALSRNTEFIGKTVVEEVSDHYKWENVSIFRPDEKDGQFQLVGQKAKESFMLPKDWHHAIGKGITGLVYRTRKALNVSDVAAPEFKGVYLSGCAESRSELCIPILVNGRVFWVLNVEASQLNAFAKEEQRALENMLGEVAVVLELVSQTQVFSQLLKLSKDSVIQTDYRDTIVQTNPATEELLGYSEDEMKGTALVDYFKDKAQAGRVQEAMREAKYAPNDEVRLICKDGLEASLLLSGTSLPPETGRNIYVCNDLSTRKRMETLEILGQMYNEIASQIKTPLSLAFAWLDRALETEMPPRDIADLLEKTVKQLHKVDLTFERMLFYERQASIIPAKPSLFDIPILVQDILQEMPETSRIEVTPGTNLPSVSGDVFQIGFCLESILAYFERFVSEDGKITVDISYRDGQVVTVVRGCAPQVTGGTITKYTEERWAIGAITEMALGERMIRSFIEQNHAGEFKTRRGEGGLAEYIVALPGA